MSASNSGRCSSVSASLMTLRTRSRSFARTRPGTSLEPSSQSQAAYPSLLRRPPMGECVDVKREGAIARVVMHRKGNNSIAEDLMQELADAFTELGGDPSSASVVLACCREKYFSVCADLTTP